MIDPILSLAFAVNAYPGVYALMLGSGVSRSSGIPTGWEIVLDLIDRLACLYGEHPEGNDEASLVKWYTAKFGREPDYSDLLEAIAQTPTERSQLLKSCFEPSVVDREQGLKMSTDAHRAIAKMIGGGHIRIVLTTNFDTLLEDALNAEGISFTLSSTPDAIKGAMPLSHPGCHIFKLHGDYRDTRILNTPTELAEYDDAINMLLDRVFDEFGLIVCGWSAKWDTALRKALERCNTHRFTTFWASRGEPTEEARQICTLRRAQIVTIKSADAFFLQLADKIAALGDVELSHPLSGPVAAALVKRYLELPRNPIRLSDLVLQETERTFEKLSVDKFPGDNKEPINDSLAREYVQKYYATVEVLLYIIAHGCYWGVPEDSKFWTRSLQRLGSLRTSAISVEFWQKQRLLPAAMLMYIGGIAAMANEHYAPVAALFNATCCDLSGNAKPSAVLLTYYYLPHDARAYPEISRKEAKFPLSAFLFAALREPLKSLLPEDTRYEMFFDKFEYLLCLVHADLRQQLVGVTSPYFPVGRFALEDHLLPKLTPNAGQASLENEVAQLGGKWPVLEAGIFGGQLDRYEKAKQQIRAAVERLRL